MAWTCDCTVTNPTEAVECAACGVEAPADVQMLLNPRARQFPTESASNPHLNGS